MEFRTEEEYHQHLSIEHFYQPLQGEVMDLISYNDEVYSCPEPNCRHYFNTLDELVIHYGAWGHKKVTVHLLNFCSKVQNEPERRSNKQVMEDSRLLRRDVVIDNLNKDVRNLKTELMDAKEKIEETEQDLIQSKNDLKALKSRFVQEKRILEEKLQESEDKGKVRLKEKENLMKELIKAKIESNKVTEDLERKLDDAICNNKKNDKEGEGVKSRQF